MHVFTGKDGFVWWVGVVEDRNDPLQLGRCRVRCYGWHTAGKSTLKTSDLPWAHPMQPITSAAMSGKGQTPLGPVEGTWVVGFFRDGDDAQQPVIIGTLGGIPQEPNDPSRGLQDPFEDRAGRPDGPYPLLTYLGEASENDSGETIYPDSEPDTNKLARGITVGTIVERKMESAKLHQDHPVANGVTGAWDEPEQPFAAQYPYNHVYESESGHTLELDDTPSHERVHIYHRSGSFQEYHPDGSRVDKIVSDHHEFIMGKEKVHVFGDTDVLIGSIEEGEQTSRFTILVRGNADIQVDQNTNILTKGDAEIHTEGNVDMLTNKNLSMQTDGNYRHDVGGTTIINSAGNMTLNAPRIDLNPPGGAGSSTIEITI